MRLNQAEVCVVARTSQTSSVRPERRSSATSCVAKSATSISSLFGTRAKTRARLRASCAPRCCAAGGARTAAPWPARTAVDCAAAASSTAFGSSRSSRVAQRHHRGAARLLQQPARLADHFAALDLGRRSRCCRPVRTPSRPLASRYTPSGMEPDSNSRSPAGREKCTAPAASASRAAGHVLSSALFRRQSMARRNSCGALDCSSSNAMGGLAAGRGGSLTLSAGTRVLCQIRWCFLTARRAAPGAEDHRHGGGGARAGPRCRIGGLSRDR